MGHLLQRLVAAALFWVVPGPLWQWADRETGGSGGWGGVREPTAEERRSSSPANVGRSTGYGTVDFAKASVSPSVKWAITSHPLLWEAGSFSFLQ